MGWTWSRLAQAERVPPPGSWEELVHVAVRAGARRGPQLHALQDDPGAVCCMMEPLEMGDFPLVSFGSL